jgi:hypothetical protein
MNHPNEEDLVLHLYGEAEDQDAVREHVEACAPCRDELALLRKVLAEVDEMPIPERPNDYGARVWNRLAKQLPRSRRWHAPIRLGYLAAAAAVILIATFLAGRFSARNVDTGRAEEGRIRERVLLVALSDHLDQSQVLLLEVVNRGETEAVPLDRERAAELLQASRLYRQTAYRVGEVATADVLEELENVLLDVSQGPDTAEAIEALRNRIQERDMLFKLRVLGSNVKKF